jgi:hypothetical protein
MVQIAALCQDHRPARPDTKPKLFLESVDADVKELAVGRYLVAVDGVWPGPGEIVLRP